MPEALAILLTQTHLSWGLTKDDVITITRTQNEAHERGEVSVEQDNHRGRSFFSRIAAAVVSAFAASSGAHAQNQDATAGGGGSLDEVVVTAQKREERLENVPISISVLEGAALDKSPVGGVRAALNTVPGVSISTDQNDSAQVTVRGVSAAVGRFGGSGVTGYYLDTIPFGLVKTAIVPDSSAYDLERVEVLRGPQGTLYGTNALNGVMRVLTNDANLETFELKTRGSTSSTQDGEWNYRGDAALNVPLIEGKLALRAVAGYESLSGWIDRPNDDNANDSRKKNARLKINAQPAENLSIGLSAWLSRIDNGSTSVADDHGKNASLIDEPNADDYDAYGLKVAYEMPHVLLTSMTSYLRSHSTFNLDLENFGIPGASVPSTFDSDVYSQEVVLTSTHLERWRWSLGGMYRHATDTVVQFLSPLLPDPLTDLDDTSESTAIYGEATRVFLDGRLELTGGLRYFEDEVKLADRVFGQPFDDNFHKISPRVVLSWHPSAGWTLYTSYAQGFRSGAQQSPGTPAGIPAVGPDTLNNYELGAKANLADGRISIDTALYYLDWKDPQQSLYVTSPITGLPVLALINGDSASGLGFDFGISARPAVGLRVGASFSWNELGFDSDVFSSGGLYAARKDRLNNSPKMTGGLSLQYEFPLGGSGMQGQFSTAANYVSDQIGRGETGNTATSDPITMVNASFSIVSASNWQATLFAENLGNEQGKVFATPFGISYMHTRPRPRTIGVQLEYHL